MSRWLISMHWRLLACATLVAPILILPCLINGHATTTLNEQSECDNSGWEITLEQFLDVWTFDIEAHQAALEKLGDTGFLQELKSSHANVGRGLSGTPCSVRRLGCSLRVCQRRERSLTSRVDRRSSVSEQRARSFAPPDGPAQKPLRNYTLAILGTQSDCSSSSQ